MRKEKNQIKTNDLSLSESNEIKNKRITTKKLSIIQQTYSTPVKFNSEQQQQESLFNDRPK
jgi:hypothetical protein